MLPGAWPAQCVHTRPLYERRIEVPKDPEENPQPRVTAEEVRTFDQRDDREGVIDLDLQDNLPRKFEFSERLKYKQHHYSADLEEEPPWRKFPRLKREQRAESQPDSSPHTEERGPRVESADT